MMCTDDSGTCNNDPDLVEPGTILVVRTESTWTMWGDLSVHIRKLKDDSFRVYSQKKIGQFESYLGSRHHFQDEMQHC